MPKQKSESMYYAIQSEADGLPAISNGYSDVDDLVEDLKLDDGQYDVFFGRIEKLNVTRKVVATLGSPSIAKATTKKDGTPRKKPGRKPKIIGAQIPTVTANAPVNGKHKEAAPERVDRYHDEMG